ncbi:MAG TPA: BTB/POZ domain-containing protein [Oculatellaceae cyanobacterium]
MLRASPFCAVIMMAALAKALQDPELSDVQFIFPGGESISCNRFMLATRSPVFRAMLFGHMMEANSDSPEIRIADASPEPFRQFIRFFYTITLATRLMCHSFTKSSPFPASIASLNFNASANPTYIGCSRLKMPARTAWMPTPTETSSLFPCVCK